MEAPVARRETQTGGVQHSRCRGQSGRHRLPKTKRRLPSRRAAHCSLLVAPTVAAEAIWKPIVCCSTRALQGRGHAGCWEQMRWSKLLAKVQCPAMPVMMQPWDRSFVELRGAHTLEDPKRAGARRGWAGKRAHRATQP